MFQSTNSSSLRGRQQPNKKIKKLNCSLVIYSTRLLSILNLCIGGKNVKIGQVNYQSMSCEDLIDIIEHQRLELIQKEAICEEYKKHLETVIEYHSVEKYRMTVQNNREADGTAPQKN